MAIERCILIAGAMKCGTTSLYNYLAQHSQIRSSALVGRGKEPKFFSSDERWGRGPAWYESCFPTIGPGQWALDGSTDCAKYPFVGDVPARLKAFDAEFKIIFMMRHPLRRMESHARHAQFFGEEVNDIRSDRKDHSLDYGISPASRAISNYAMQIDVFREWFDRGDLLLVAAEELKADPASVIERTLKFIGLPPIASLSVPTFQNRAGERRSKLPLLQMLDRTPRLNRLLRSIAPAWARQRMWKKLEVPGRFRLTPDEEQSLIAELMPSLVRLRDDYGVDASTTWGIPLSA